MSNSIDLKLVNVVLKKHFPECIFDICFEVIFFLYHWNNIGVQSKNPLKKTKG